MSIRYSCLLSVTAEKLRHLPAPGIVRRMPRQAVLLFAFLYLSSSATCMRAGPGGAGSSELGSVMADLVALRPVVATASGMFPRCCGGLRSSWRGLCKP
jgi:hypothetical protein